jgi:hypothetical protein
MDPVANPVHWYSGMVLLLLSTRDVQEDYLAEAGKTTRDPSPKADGSDWDGQGQVPSDGDLG